MINKVLNSEQTSVLYMTIPIRLICLWRVKVYQIPESPTLLLINADDFPKHHVCPTHIEEEWIIPDVELKPPIQIKDNNKKMNIALKSIIK